MSNEEERLYAIARVRALVSAAEKMLRDANQSVPAMTGSDSEMTREWIREVHKSLCQAMAASENAFHKIGKLLP